MVVEMIVFTKTPFPMMIVYGGGGNVEKEQFWAYKS